MEAHRYSPKTTAKRMFWKVGLLVVSMTLCAWAVCGQASCHQALVVVDVQERYLARCAWITVDGADLLAKVSALAERARKSNVPVVYVQNLDPDLPQASPLPTFPAAIAPRENDLVVQKDYPSGFYETDLQA